MLKFLLLAVVPLVIAVLTLSSSRSSSHVRKLTAAQARDILRDTPGAVAVDVREPDEYDAGHIPGAVSLPIGSLTRAAASALPDKSAPLLVYCETGARSARAAEQLSGLGYENVSDFGGLRSWSYDVVTTAQEQRAGSASAQ